MSKDTLVPRVLLVQATVEKAVSFSGTGLHTGTRSKITIEPAPPDNGIVFYNSKAKIPALVDFVSDTKHGVCLRYENSEVKTCEHLLSALNGIGISNALIKIEGIEVPALDGSSFEFTKFIKPKLQHKKNKIIEIRKPIFVGEGDASIFIIPDKSFKVSFLIDYPDPGLSTQHACFTISSKTYLKEIASARTYSFEVWISKLKKAGLIKGGNLNNAIVIGKNGPLCKLRYPDEPVRHKILDVVGDLSLVGANIKGWVFGIKAGHTLNTKLAKRILEVSNKH